MALMADYERVPHVCRFLSHTAPLTLNRQVRWSGSVSDSLSQAASCCLVSASQPGAADNEPGLEKQMGTAEGNVKARRYNEGALLYSGACAADDFGQTRPRARGGLDCDARPMM